MPQLLLLLLLLPPVLSSCQTVPMGVPPFMGTHPSFSMAGATGAPMMPMVRPGFPATGATPGAPMSPGAAQSPRKPPPPRNALDDLNIKDFM